MSGTVTLTEEITGVDWNEGFYQKLGFRRLRTAYIWQEDFEAWSSMGYLDESRLQQ